MKRAASHDDCEMRAEYDFSSAVKNPYAERFTLGSNIVMIEPEIFAAFPREEAVNDALALLMRKQYGARVARRRPGSKAAAQGAGSR